MRRAYQQKKAVAAGSLVAARVGCGHYYEVIREGAPCHLYFDIEYKRAYNCAVNGPAMTGLFSRFVLEQVMRAYKM